jgi:hypothetical protein
VELLTSLLKLNNHLSPKESLSSDGQQFHQHQQNKKNSSLNRDVQQYHQNQQHKQKPHT